MYLKIIDDPEAVGKHCKQFVRQLRSRSREKISVRLGHMGASSLSHVLWSPELGIWMSFDKNRAERFNHAFGVGRPLPDSVLSTACEINFPAGGIDRRMGGVFARDRKGQVFVAHRGKIGGGRKGIGKSLFENHYRGVWSLMEDGEQESVVAVIGAVKSNRFPRQLAHFVLKVDQLKSLAAYAPSPQVTLSFPDTSFREEWTGSKQYEFFRDMAGLCDQALVVRDLYQALKAKGYRVANDPFRDLFILDGTGRIRSLFHIQTDMRPAALQSGVAQLLLQSLNLPHRTRLFLVIPACPEPDFRQRLQKTTVEILVYQWQGEEASFPELGTNWDREAPAAAQDMT